MHAPKTPIPPHLRTMIHAGNLADALSLCKMLAVSWPTGAVQQLLLIQSAYTQLNQGIAKGTLNKAVVDTQSASIQHALLQLLDTYESATQKTVFRGIRLPSTSTPDPVPPMDIESDESVSIQSPANTAPRKILFLASNPTESSSLRIDVEVRQIEEGLKRAPTRDILILKPYWAVRIADLRRAVLEESPHIIHFSGHGQANGILVEDDQGENQQISTTALSNFLALFAGQIECIVLNACYSAQQASLLTRWIPFVIGIPSTISDKAAVAFSVAFYEALGNSRDYAFSFQYAYSALELEGIAHNGIKLYKKQG